MSLQYQSAWITLAPQNFKKSYNFYSQLLGKSPDRTLSRSNQIIYAEFHLIGFNLGIYEPSPRPEPKPKHQSQQALEAHDDTRNSPLSLCFQVENLEDAIELVTNLGYPPPGEIMNPSHGREIYVFDPDDNRLILYQPNL